MMSVRKILLSAAAASVLLSGCVFGPPTLSTRSYERFVQSFDAIISDLAARDAEKARDFEMAFKKITAFAALKLDRVDLSNPDAMVIVDAASVLPRSYDAIQRTAFAMVGEHLDGLDADRTLALAGEWEAAAVRAYEAKFDEAIHAVDARIRETEAHEAAARALVGNIGFSSPSVGLVRTGGALLPDFRATITNGDVLPVSYIDLQVVLYGNDGEVVANKLVGVNLASTPLAAGEAREIAIMLADPDWYRVGSARRLPVRVAALAFRRPDGSEISNYAELAAIQELRRRREILAEKRKALPRIVRDSFS